VQDIKNNVQNLASLRGIDVDVNEPELRFPLLNKYPRLISYDRILFKVLFSDVIYKKDIRLIVRECVDEQDMIRLKKNIEKDKKSMEILSTYSINFIYNLDNYLYKNKRSGFVSPDNYYKIAKNGYTGKAVRDKHNLRLYLLTHCILGESRFYSRKIRNNQEVYIKMIKLAEKIISEHFFEISLDNKLEFIACARMLGYRNSLVRIIFSECENSLAHCGNYLVDSFNVNNSCVNKNDFVSSEHRNILYLMTLGDSPRFGKCPI